MNEARKHAAALDDRQARLPGVTVAPVWDPTEREFQRTVIQGAHALGWIVAHFHTIKDARRGWVTPAAADGAGWPDLVLVGRGRILFRELKTRSGRLSVDQTAWGEHLTAAGADYAVWRPQDWPDRIMAELGSKVAA